MGHSFLGMFSACATSMETLAVGSAFYRRWICKSCLSYSK
ncbi:hypothetical protein AAHB63_10155 [Bacillus thuringiensis]